MVSRSVRVYGLAGTCAEGYTCALRVVTRPSYYCGALSSDSAVIHTSLMTDLSCKIPRRDLSSKDSPTRIAGLQLQALAPCR
uniref:Uncharacterized protein n=1 Tax=Knipowitschia caucasica TaxID=637954 RepID=A0AAV2L6V5_KNICA